MSTFERAQEIIDMQSERAREDRAQKQKAAHDQALQEAREFLECMPPLPESARGYQVPSQGVHNPPLPVDYERLDLGAKPATQPQRHTPGNNQASFSSPTGQTRQYPSGILDNPFGVPQPAMHQPPWQTPAAGLSSFSPPNHARQFSGSFQGNPFGLQSPQPMTQPQWGAPGSNQAPSSSPCHARRFSGSVLDDPFGLPAAQPVMHMPPWKTGPVIHQPPWQTPGGSQTPTSSPYHTRQLSGGVQGDPFGFLDDLLDLGAQGMQPQWQTPTGRSLASTAAAGGGQASSPFQKPTMSLQQLYGSPSSLPARPVTQQHQRHASSGIPSPWQFPSPQWRTPGNNQPSVSSPHHTRRFSGGTYGEIFSPLAQPTMQQPEQASGSGQASSTSSTPTRLFSGIGRPGAEPFTEATEAGPASSHTRRSSGVVPAERPTSGRGSFAGGGSLSIDQLEQYIALTAKDRPSSSPAAAASSSAAPAPAYRPPHESFSSPPKPSAAMPAYKPSPLGSSPPLMASSSGPANKASAQDYLPSPPPLLTLPPARTTSAPAAAVNAPAPKATSKRARTKKGKKSEPEPELEPLQQRTTSGPSEQGLWAPTGRNSLEAFYERNLDNAFIAAGAIAAAKRAAANNNNNAAQEQQTSQQPQTPEQDESLPVITLGTPLISPESLTSTAETPAQNSNPTEATAEQGYNAADFGMDEMDAEGELEPAMGYDPFAEAETAAQLQQTLNTAEPPAENGLEPYENTPLNYEKYIVDPARYVGIDRIPDMSRVPLGNYIMSSSSSPADNNPADNSANSLPDNAVASASSGSGDDLTATIGMTDEMQAMVGERMAARLRHQPTPGGHYDSDKANHTGGGGPFKYAHSPDVFMGWNGDPYAEELKDFSNSGLKRKRT
ncbi:hypothetical protein QBC46DRAFT_412469 [Diplogelasinospora grovesii]|uniref:Uncharacterized protein n=1 Tax=Diplogelasinospora grovesii TaxID=303347 RepID=A0AAN6N1E5_9PEZI|nr:hypothetical protein QBC46DRAFT_412469 [Diplogelasinospora grovesii]